MSNRKAASFSTVWKKAKPKEVKRDEDKPVVVQGSSYENKDVKEIKNNG